MGKGEGVEGGEVFISAGESGRGGGKSHVRGLMSLGRTHKG